MTKEYLNRTVPFIIHNSDPGNSHLLMDSIEIRLSKNANVSGFKRIARSIDLDQIAEQFPPDEAIELVRQQYEVCMNYIFSHPVWESFRNGTGSRSLLAYILETRHYLFAASSRMSTGISSCWQYGPLSLVLSEHLVEEADHAIFFENSLKTLGCSSQAIQLAKPSPITNEWIYLMRSISARDPLVSAVCSGLMEFSASNREAVKGWHQMLIEKKILNEETVNKFYEHVKLDIELGHGECWIDALQSKKYLSGEKLSECLNSVCIVSEMLYRWFDSLQYSYAGRLVELMPDLTFENSDDIKLDNYFNGLPVFPAFIYHQAAWGESDDLSESLKNVLAIGYHYEDKVLATDTTSSFKEIIKEATGFQKKVKAPEFTFSDYASLEKSIKSWLCAIDGHLLWQEMIESPDLSLIYGWLIENYYYLSTAYHHSSSAIASCPYDDIRNEFIKHLKEELTHADILQKEIKKIRNVISPELHRPLPTTIAFTGFLKELASYDWKAYCIALAFLQFSLNPGDKKHTDFYKTITKKNDKVKHLLGSIQQHDLIDQSMGHENDMRKILELLLDKKLITREVVSRAAMITQLTWSFLDGVRTHYKKGLASVNQRVGWSSNGIAWN